MFNSHRSATQTRLPDYFVCEIYNPSGAETSVTLGLRATREPLRLTPYQKLITLPPGFLRVCIPYSEMAPHFKPDEEFTIAIGPNINAPEEEGLVLYFGLMAFVGANPTFALSPAYDAHPGTGNTVKVVIWDLDNTLWHGILTEDEPENLRLRDGVVEIIRTLDSRGVVNSVVSKNDFEAAWDRVKAFGLDDYFVFSRIGWAPKGQAVKEVIEDFNVGEDTVVFIDDSAFERFEVKSVNPHVRVMDVSDTAKILEAPEFNPPVTDESAQRRHYYRNEERRQQFRASVTGTTGTSSDSAASRSAWPARPP